MMGTTHVVTGMATWQIGCLIAATEGRPPNTYVVVVGTALCGFGALLPDIDVPASTTEDGGERRGSLVAQSLGPLTQAAARTTAWLSRWVYARTAAPADRPCKNGHRTLTHTLPFCLAVMLGFGALGQHGGLWAPLAVVFWAAATAIRAALPDGRRSFSPGRAFSRMGKRSAAAARTAALWDLRGVARRWRRVSKWCKRLAWLTGPVRVPIAPGGAVLVGLVMWWWPAPSGWWLGYAIGAGCLVHCLGDAMTHYGVPLLWPWPVRGQVWFPVRPRPQWRFTTGGRRREEVDQDGRVVVVDEDRVEEYVLGCATVVGFASTATVGYLAWWPAVVGWWAAVQAWWPIG